MSTELLVPATSTETVVMAPSSFTGWSASALRKHFKLTLGYKGKDLTAKVNQELAAHQPLGDAMIAKIRQDGFTFSRFVQTKSGNYSVSLKAPSIQRQSKNAKAQLDAALAKIAELEAKLATPAIEA